jgi:hypothetical protein
MVVDLSDLNETPEEESVKISADTFWLMQTVGEIASSVCGADFLLQISPMEDDGGVTLIMASKLYPDVLLGAKINKDPEAQIRRLCAVIATKLYDQEDEKAEAAAGLIVPKKELIRL